MASDTFRSPHGSCPPSTSQLTRSSTDFAAALGDPRRHRTLVGGQAPVGHQEQLRIEQLPVQAFDRQSSRTTLPDDVQHCFGALHYACLPPLNVAITCAPSPCDRLSRPPRQVVAPATTTGTPSP